MFESDTDSAAERHSVASSRSALLGRLQRPRPTTNGTSKPKKELVTETKYLLTSGSGGGLSKGKQEEKRRPLVEARNGSARLQTSGGPVPNWDYSLRVNRMSGDRVDSRVK